MDYDNEPPVKVTSTRNGRTYTTLTAEARAKRDSEIIDRRDRGQPVLDIAHEMDLPRVTVYDVIKRMAGRSYSRKARAKPIVPTTTSRRGLNAVPALTREQVDPEFKGTPIEFVDKYGHVQMQTAEARATSRFGDWAIVIGYLAKQFKKQPALPAVDLDWLRSPRKADVERMRSAVALLKPVLDQAEVLLNRTGSRAESAFDMHAHLVRQREWSEKTFGPGPRTGGIIDHITKELIEIEADPGDVKEWLDVVVLALDGAWRAGATPDQIIDLLVAKQDRNEKRVWPDWRTMSPDKAIEHDRSHDAQQI
jgi:hypothetical protein